MQDAILDLAYEVSRITAEKIDLIEAITRQTHFLALNARIEAARAGANGAAFSVVAQEMSTVSTDINGISRDLRVAIDDNIARLRAAGSDMMTDFRGTRLTDLAHNAVELIDRNLYERSCDVRWWATDSAVVDAAASREPASSAFASSRLATILRSYTVYLDLWITDRSGRVIANGRPETYPGAVGCDASGERWFTEAMQSRDGDSQTVKPLNGAATAIYAAAIREEGRTNGAIIGVLGIFFDWAPQAAAIVQAVGMNPEEKAQCRVMLLDARRRIIAASDGKGLLTETYGLKAEAARGFYREQGRLIAYAITPGYETYRGLGWYGVIEWRAGP